MSATMTTVESTKTYPSLAVRLWRSFRWSTWLGWQIESNWTDPFLFAIYSFIKPLSAAGILVVMYAVITSSDFGSPVFSYMYIGNAFYILVGAMITGISWSVIDDREHYKTLKYIYIAPIEIPFYLLGRGIARLIVAFISVIITLTFGVLFLNVDINLMAVNWPLFLAALGIGLAMLAMIGMLLAGISLLLVNQVGFVGESVAGALYVFSGAIFPLNVLPVWLQPIGYVMPVTYWLELIRRSMVGGIAEAFPTLAQFDNSMLLLILVGLTLVFGTISAVVFRWCEFQARERGLIDRVTNY